MYRQVLKGTTDVSVNVRFIDSADGTPETGVSDATAGLALWYRRGGGLKVAITPASLTALDSAHNDGGVEHISDGMTRIDLPDAACATGANGVEVGGSATGMIVIGAFVQLVGYDPFDAVRMGMTALPNVASGSAGAIPTTGTGSNQISVAAGLVTLAGVTHTGAVIPTVTTLTGHTAQTGDTFARLGAPAGASVSADIAAIEAQTDDIGAAGAGLTAVPWNAAWDAQVESEVDDALAAIQLDTLVQNAVADVEDIANNSVFARLVSKSATADFSSYNHTTDAMEAMRDRSSLWETDLPLWEGLLDTGSTTTVIVLGDTPAISDALDAYVGAILEIEDTSTTPDVEGQRQIVSVDLGASTVTVAPPFATAPAVTATGRIWLSAPNVLNAAGLQADAVTEIQSGLATAAALTVVDDFLDTEVATILAAVDTEIAAILADTNELQTDWANGGRLDVILDARASQTSVDDIPTNAELAAALGTADDAVLAAIVTLQADTDDIQTRLPAALVSGRMDASVGAMAANVMTAAAAAADLTTELQAGLATAASVSTLQTSVDDLPTNAELATSQAAADDATLAAIAAVDVRLDTEIPAILAAVDTEVAAIKATTDKLDTAVVLDGAVWQLTANALELAPTGGGGGLDAAGVRAAIGLATANLDTQLDDIPTNTDLATALGTADDAMLAAIATVQADTDNIQTRIPAALVSGRMDSSVGAAAANVFTAASAAADLTTELQAGLATAAAVATLQTSVDDVPTNAELATSQAGADDATLAAITAAVAPLATAAGVTAATANLDAAISTRATPAQVNTEVLDVFTVDTFAEPAAVPAATASLKDKLGWLTVLARNRRTQSATAQVVRNDGDTAAVATSTTSDDGTTFAATKWS